MALRWLTPRPLERRRGIVAIAEDIDGRITIELRASGAQIVLTGVLPGGANDAYYTGKRFASVEEATAWLDRQFAIP